MKIIKNVVLHTGAAHTIINPDSIHKLGIKAEPEDEFVTMYGASGEQYAYRKEINLIGIEDKNLKNIEIDFGMIDEDGYINGLIGLDVLIKLEANINLKNLVLEI